MEQRNYFLRQAAGAWWLVDVSQSGADYRPPLQLNEMGATIVKLCSTGVGRQEIVRQLCADYEADPERITRDVEAFLGALAQQGIEITDGKGTVRI